MGAARDVPAGIYNVVDDKRVPFAEYLAGLAQALGVPKPIRLPTILEKWMFGGGTPSCRPIFLLTYRPRVGMSFSAQVRERLFRVRVASVGSFL